MRKQKFFVVYYDPADDIVVFGAVSLTMKVYRGEIGYREFAGKRIAHVFISINGDGETINCNGSYNRYDRDGFIDIEWRDNRVNELLEFSPTWGMRVADPITRRRIEEGKFYLDWENNPSVTQRVVDYIYNGTKHSSVKTSRQLTRLDRTKD